MLGKEVPAYEVDFFDSHRKKVVGRIVGAPIKNEEGKIVREIVMVSNVTEQKRIEETLRKSEGRLIRFLNSATESFILLDHGLNIVELNKLALETFGLSRREIIGKNLLELDPIFKESGRYEKYREVIRTGKSFSADDTIPHAKFGMINVAIKAFKVGDGLGIILGDITSRKQMEKDLIQALEELKRKNKELDDYTYTVSHDLREPLITIQGLSEMLYRKYGDKLDRSMVPYIRRISSASQWLERLVSDLLELSRAGKKAGEFREVKVKSILGLSLKSIESLLRKKHVELKQPSDFPTIYCDKTGMQQVFNNLLDNALKYMGSQRKPKVEIGWSKNKDQYIFWVKDNGIGIKKEDQEKIFHAFYRGSGASKEGTGIGLSIAKKVIESHGGKIWVKSRPGRGSTFYFIIPARESSL